MADKEVENFVDSGKCINPSDTERNKQTGIVEAEETENACVSDEELDTGKEPTSENVIDRKPDVSMKWNNSDHPFSIQTWKDDLKLIVEGRSLFVSRAVLGVFSPVFNLIFEDGPVDTLEIQDTTFDAMLEFLCCLYPHIRKPVTVDNIHSVMKLADKYQVRTLIADCQALIEQKAVASTTVEDLLSFLMVCREFEFKYLEDLCFQALAKKDLFEVEAAGHVYDDGKYALIARNIQRLTFEQYKHLKDKLVSLEKEKDDHKAMYLFLLGSLTHENKERTMSVFGGNLHTITVKYACTKVEAKLRGICKNNSTISNEDISISAYRMNCEMVLRLSISFTLESSFIVYGRLVFRNFAQEDQSKVFPFYKENDNHESVTVYEDLKLNKIIGPEKGFLMDEEGEIEIQYIFKQS